MQSVFDVSCRVFLVSPLLLRTEFSYHLLCIVCYIFIMLYCHYHGGYTLPEFAWAFVDVSV